MFRMSTWGVIFMVWFGFALLGGIMDGTFLVSADESTINTLESAQILSQPSDAITLNPIKFITAVTTYFQRIMDMLTWNFSFLRGGFGEYIRYLFFLPVSAVVFLGMIIAFTGLIRR